MRKPIVVELKDESGKISGGLLSLGQGVCHFTPREPIRKDLLFYPHIDGLRVSAVLRLVPADWCMVFNENLDARAIARSWGSEFPDPIVGDPFSGMGAYLVPVINGEPVQYGSKLEAARDKECGLLIRRRRATLRAV